MGATAVRIEEAPQRGVLIVELSGEFDVALAERFRAQIDQRLQRDRHLFCLVLDMRGVTFLDSTGIGAILGRYRRLAGRGGRLCVAGLRPNVRRLFELAGISQVIPAYPDVAAALRDQTPPRPPEAG
ncbi:MAG TPA: anti-sigma factor antagonist [Limnochordia bacterium]